MEEEERNPFGYMSSTPFCLEVLTLEKTVNYVHEYIRKEDIHRITKFAWDLGGNWVVGGGDTIPWHIFCIIIIVCFFTNVVVTTRSVCGFDST